jgi:predicted transcriptional regulator
MQNTNKMKNLSLKLDEEVFDETEKIVSEINVNRNLYINKAIAFFNELQKKKILGTQLETESRLVQQESMKVLAEFEKLDDEATAI